MNLKIIHMKTIGIQRKKLISLIIVILICFAFSTSCEVEDKEYKPVEFLKISGVTSVTANSTKDYYTFYIDNTNYAWSVPAGSSITSGQGTSHITVLFGDAGGILSVEAAGMSDEIEITIIE
jgi:hypothetical protein